MSRLGTHAERLDRFLGPVATEQLSRSMRDWYGPPIAVAGVPGNVWAHKGGDFRGTAREGGYLNAVDFAVAALRRRWRKATNAERHAKQFGTGFASLSDLIAEATAGKKYDWAFTKIGSTGVVGVTNSLWRAGPVPQSGVAPANAPGGTAYNSASAGGFPYTNPSGGDTLHFVWAACLANFVNTLLLYDLIFGVNKAMSSTATESVTGVPTRYQSSSPSAVDYAGGNFLFVQIGGTQLGATGHNWTVCLYRNQAGTDGQTLPSLTGNTSAIVDRLDHPAQQWFAPLAAGDGGITDLAQMQSSGSITVGVVWFMIGHPIALIPIPLVNIACQVDGIATAFNLARIFDNACLAFLELNKPATNATTYNGGFAAVAG